MRALPGAVQARYSLYSLLEYTLVLTQDSVAPGNFRVWSSTPGRDPFAELFSSIFTMEGGVKRSADTLVLLRGSGPSVPNVVVSDGVESWQYGSSVLVFDKLLALMAEYPSLFGVLSVVSEVTNSSSATDVFTVISLSSVPVFYFLPDNLPAGGDVPCWSLWVLDGLM